MKNQLNITSLYLVFLILFGFSSTAIGQTCPCQLSSLHFATQQEIDDFSNAHPGCTKIYANIYIGELSGNVKNTDIVNLSGLSQISHICGSLTIKSTAALGSLAGLNNLVYLGNSLNIHDNSLLQNFAGLEKLKLIDGNLTISDNPSFTSFQGLSALDTITASLIVYNNGLTTLNGIRKNSANSTQILGAIEITNNPSLSDCAGLSICAGIAQPGKTITIKDNASGCNSVAEIEADCTVLSVKDVKSKNLNIYPNPTSSQLSIRVLKAENIDILDIAGNVLQQNILLSSGTNTIQIEDFPSGIYLIRTEQGAISKFIKY